MYFGSCLQVLVCLRVLKVGPHEHLHLCAQHVCSCVLVCVRAAHVFVCACLITPLPPKASGRTRGLGGNLID